MKNPRVIGFDADKLMPAFLALLLLSWPSPLHASDMGGLYYFFTCIIPAAIAAALALPTMGLSLYATARGAQGWLRKAGLALVYLVYSVSIFGILWTIPLITPGKFRGPETQREVAASLAAFGVGLLFAFLCAAASHRALRAGDESRTGAVKLALGLYVPVLLAIWLFIRGQ